jgi:uroporphyrinogen-III synthase
MAALLGEGIRTEAIAFIETLPLEDPGTTTAIRESFQDKSTVVFTSMNAVQSVADRLAGKVPDWRIFTMGTATRDRVVRHFGEGSIAGTGHDATSLADAVIQSGQVEDLLFFCGDIRRDELPERLAIAGIRVREIRVYRTLETPVAIDRPFDGILFFSPSAVRSFFSANRPPADTLLFAIGETTAAEIREHAGNTVIVSEAPGKDDMVKTVIRYFSGRHRD